MSMRFASSFSVVCFLGGVVVVEVVFVGVGSGGGSVFLVDFLMFDCWEMERFVVMVWVIIVVFFFFVVAYSI